MENEKVNEKVFDLLEKTGLNWTVTKDQLFDTSARKTGSYGIFRKDNDAWLGTVTDRYEPLQNWEMAQVMISAAHELGLEASHGGLLKDGQLVYIQMPLQSVHIGNSDVTGLLTSLNSHDGTTSFGFGSSKTTVICQNTWHRAYLEVQKFRHTASLKKRIEIAKNNMVLALAADKNMVANFNLMAAIPAKVEIVEKVMSSIFKLTEESKKQMSERRYNQVKSFLTAVDTSIKEQGDSLWSIFNGVTRYTTHIASPADPKEKQVYLMTGAGNEISNIGYSELMKFVNENTEKSKSFAV